MSKWFGFGFECEEYRPDKKYDKDAIFVCTVLHFELAKQLVNDGHKVLIENFQEAEIDQLIDSDLVRYSQCMHDPSFSDKHIPLPLFFWYKESIQFDYRNLPRNISPTKQFLLKMNYQRDFRDAIHRKFGDIIEDNLYSYVSMGIQMPDDMDRESKNWDRYINPSWYDSTWYSIVVESSVNRGTDRIFITEKTFKPFAMKHPFMSISCKNTLKLLKDSGFAVFENMFDQQYDNLDLLTRIDSIYQQAKNNKITGYDKLTLEQIEHNFHHFYDRDLIISRINRELLDPLREFAES
jgi:hypothetical protein